MSVGSRKFHSPIGSSNLALNTSALSWYFLNLFGLNGVFKLILGADNGTYSLGYRSPVQLTFAAAVDTRDATSTAMLSGAGVNPMGPAQDMAKPFKAEVENLALAESLYTWAGEGIEDRVLAKWGKV